MQTNTKQAHAATQETFLDTNQAAEFLSLQPATLTTWRCRSRCGPPFRRFGRAIRYALSDLILWANHRSAQCTGDPLLGGQDGIPGK